MEFLRGTGSAVHQRLRALIASNGPLATTDVVVMEVMAGARDHAHAVKLRDLLLSGTLLPVLGLSDFEQAAAIYRRCRNAGATVRSLADCVIARVAIREGASILHADRDFGVIAAHCPLMIAG